MKLKELIEKVDSLSLICIDTHDRVLQDEISTNDVKNEYLNCEITSVSITTYDKVFITPILCITIIYEENGQNG